MIMIIIMIIIFNNNDDDDNDRNYNDNNDNSNYDNGNSDDNDENLEFSVLEFQILKLRVWITVDEIDSEIIKIFIENHLVKNFTFCWKYMYMCMGPNTFCLFSMQGWTATAGHGV